MRRWSLIASLASLLVGVVVGLAVGYRIGFRQFEAALVNEVVGTLGRQVEVLSRLRTGDREGAVEVLESSMDNGVQSIAGARPEMMSQARSTFGAVKVYRSVYPSTPAVAAALEPIDAVDLRFCTPALRELAKSAHPTTPGEAPKPGPPPS